MASGRDGGQQGSGPLPGSQLVIGSERANIRVNAVSPGPIDTPGLRGFLGIGAETDQMLAYFVQSIPLGRVGSPEDMAKAVLFIASDDSSFLTCTELFVDGGMAQI
jgi:NAD(P)-dependent dehydrogenase (short-subunit alcohol dehydrogenase family)